MIAYTTAFCHVYLMLRLSLRFGLTIEFRWTAGDRPAGVNRGKGSHFEQDVILWGIRWYVADPISYCQLEEIMEERGVTVGHSALNLWVLKYAPLLERIPDAQVSSGS